MTILAVLVTLAGSVIAGWALAELVLRFARVEDGAVESKPRTPVLEAQKPQTEVLGGGTWIGVLERLAVTGAILAGQPGLIAVVVAIKGLGRWADLQSNPVLTERFIIGTMTSYLVAAACGALGLWWLSAL